jgi:hypothetical protein
LLSYISKQMSKSVMISRVNILQITFFIKMLFNHFIDQICSKAGMVLVVDKGPGNLSQTGGINKNSVFFQQYFSDMIHPIKI